MVILDTDHMTFLEHGDGPTVAALRARMTKEGVGNCATTIISYEEQMRVHRGSSGGLSQNQETLEQLLLDPGDGV